MTLKQLIADPLVLYQEAVYKATGRAPEITVGVQAEDFLNLQKEIGQGSDEIRIPGRGAIVIRRSGPDPEGVAEMVLRLHGASSSGRL